MLSNGDQDGLVGEGISNTKVGLGILVILNVGLRLSCAGGGVCGRAKFSHVDPHVTPFSRLTMASSFMVL